MKSSVCVSGVLFILDKLLHEQSKGLLLDSTELILLCRRAERDSNVTLFSVHMSNIGCFLNSRSADSAFGGTWVSNQLSLIIEAASEGFLYTMRTVAENEVSLSTMWRIGIDPSSL